MSNKPSNIIPGSTPELALVPGLVAGMENPDTHTLEVVQVGELTEDGSRFGFNWQTGSRRFEGEFADVAGAKLYRLPPSLAAAGRRFRASRNKRRSPVPPTPKGFDHSQWLAACNCD